MPGEPIKMDYAFSLAQVLKTHDTISEDELRGMAGQVADVHRKLMAQRQDGKLGFMDLPGQGETELSPILDEATRLQGVADTLVVLGIGGSALGATAVDMALAGSLRLGAPRPAGAMRLLVADNSDPRFFGQLLDIVDPARTAFNVVSKSGSTAETMSQYLVARELLDERLGADEARRHLCFTTDPVAGNLRKIAADEPISVLNVPPNVGGRYSVLSAVGLLPLACAGHDVKALLAGAARMQQRCASEDVLQNPAYLLAALTVLYARKGRNVLVTMPYATDLFGLAQWFAQLWAESLGKAADLDGRPAHTGQTPVAAIGATDQHSQLQLYMEGPRDKLIMFLDVADYGRELIIPGRHQDISGLSYLGGRDMGELIKAEARATAAALASQGRPSLTFKLPRIDAHVLGQIIYLLELATVTAGGLLNIDPLDQPGVELGKKLTYGLMGREGYAEQAALVDELDQGGRHQL